MFGVEALKDSRKFAEAHFGDVSAVKGTAFEKETILANLGPLADLLDQYAIVCNEVISLFAHVILRLFEAINNIGSPLEIFTSSCFFLLTLLYSMFHLLVHEQISVVQIGNASIRFIAPNCRRFTCTISQCFYPFILTMLHILLMPVRFLCDLCVSLIGMIPIPRSKRVRRHSSNCGTDDVSRITCCVCFIHEKSILLQPCNHICLCAFCIEELLDTYEEPICPLCRCIITSYVDVYI
uniref:RING-type domain-containing protein n=1 Tax=Elaeophora elaphi TaxID=1147741 RepID=A0A0R3S318_9BILA